MLPTYCEFAASITYPRVGAFTRRMVELDDEHLRAQLAARHTWPC